jgi:(p)ppGpp synthase/HD superfamily hydrolase
MKETAKEWAFNKHHEVNQKYGGYLPYSYHLNLVVAVATKFITLIPEEDRDLVISACYLHDTLEDCHVSYIEIAKEFNTELAEIVYAVTNDKGRNRKQRAGEAYYEGIRNTKYAIFVKVCDRIANVLYSCMFGSSMFELYGKEQKAFAQNLYNSKYRIMFEALETLFKTKTFGFEPISDEVY